jgi:hypothetical protein
MKNIQNFDDFLNEKKKMNAGFAAYLAKKKKGADDKGEDKDEEKTSKHKHKKDDDECEDDKEEGTKGLTAKQKKLPIGLQKAILARQKKK